MNYFSYRQNELKEGAMRAVGRQYYYLDYRRFCDVVKWRVAEMRRKIISTTRNVSLISFSFALTKLFWSHILIGAG
jgi:hypothetical protein